MKIMFAYRDSTRIDVVVVSSSGHIMMFIVRPEATRWDVQQMARMVDAGTFRKDV